MKILLVNDQFFAANNGMTISAQRFARVLENHGNEVRVVSYGTPATVKEPEKAYLMDKFTVYGFDWLISSQGMTFAKADDAVLIDAITWADVVHFLTPFALSHHGIEIAKNLHVPFTAAFHVQPENITSSIKLGKVGFINDLIYRWFNHYIYKYCGHIHCPSKFIAGELQKRNYKGKLHVISNGIDPDFIGKRNIEKSIGLKDKFVILMVGRLSVEKRQDVLIDAVKKSRYADKIQLILAGNGPRKTDLINRSEGLKNPIIINFYNKNDLLNIIAQSDLYVHASDMEIEAMSCMEAFAGGLVPIIANSKKSATPQFALDDRSLFNAGDSSDLAQKIDYWYENDSERCVMGREYVKLGQKYDLDSCVLAAEKMFFEAINDSKNVAQAENEMSEQWA
ncbi:MAG: glycosyltransferase [Clostridiales bacterium]|nr:MAG: glycosyltransferase [Clostridiales bacterium]